MKLTYRGVVYTVHTEAALIELLMTLARIEAFEAA